MIVPQKTKRTTTRQ